MRLRLCIYVGALLALLIGCGRGEPEKAGVPYSPPPAPSVGERTVPPEAPPAVAPEAPSARYKLEITPGEVHRNSVLKLRAKGFELAEARVIWIVDGLDRTTAREQEFDVAAENLSKGSRIQAKALVDGGTVHSDTLEVLNSPPQVKTLILMPEGLKQGQNVYVRAEGEDPDGDPVSMSYEWKKNGVPAGTSERMELEVKRGDRFEVKVTPYDGELQGRPVRRVGELLNALPVFSPYKAEDYGFQNEVYTFQANAYDPDGDQIKYSLSNAPAGMTVDDSTGYVKWEVPRDAAAGQQSYTIVATDSHGGKSTYTITLAVKVEKRDAAAGKGAAQPGVENSPSRQPEVANTSATGAGK